ncbi:subtilisin-like protease SBT5.6 [Senna tora]|uniref:Subtilisin-like protease SBT5.6 n=1 Tax=Senna tora TaxID=362788 RepID=A0A834X8Y8_9FABA|nr:subtilisin-like protease SBT5.6 [Senna tora]
MAMKNATFVSSSLLLFFFLLPLASTTKNSQIYIVEFGEHNADENHDIQTTHHSYLLSVKETEEEAQASLLYSYKHTLNGFSAVLTPQEANRLSEMEGVVSVYKSQPQKYYLHTTRSWRFVGLEEPLNPWTLQSNHKNRHLLSKAKYGEDLIVGMIDSESKSFSDVGMGPIPQRWKGICQNGTAFSSSHCNRKIVGARYYLQGYETFYGPLNEEEDYRSARDKDGHGTHTASIVAGRIVPGASALGGFANGSASGGAPLARLAIYKACWPIKGQSKDMGNVCLDIDMLKAIDDAIEDGVDVLSISIGFPKPIFYRDDVIARGALEATKKNIVVVCSAGNSGPLGRTLSNPAPWVITVGASTLDRAFVAPIRLHNGTRIEGRSITPIQKKHNFQELVFAGDAVNSSISKIDSGYCLDGSLEPSKVEGKIVLCMRGKGARLAKGLEVKRAGGVGFILGNNQTFGNDVPSDLHFIPATGVSYENALKLLDYIHSSPNPKALVLPGTTLLNTKPAPSMASFSSRGPNVVDPFILKPDITAPGVDILAAWTDADGPTRMSFQDNRVVKYNIFSGTSMSCPHVAAAAVLLKAIHPTWTSAAIRSALITTAATKDNTGKPLKDETGKTATPFAYGSGHFQPTKASDPGLVYDASYTDYILHTCSLGETQDLKLTYNCPKPSPEPYNLNYPSIQIHRLNDTKKTIKRTVTNVGSPNSVYKFSAKPPKEYTIMASPNVLEFDHVGQKKSFTITVIAKRGQVLTNNAPDDEYYFGWYAWTYKHHVVRSTVAVSFQ